MLSALAFVVIFAVLSVLAFVRDPIYGLYLYFLTFFVHPPSRWWGASLPDLRWALLAAAIMATGILISGRKIPQSLGKAWFTTVPAIALTALVLWMSFQSIWALDLEAHWRATTFIAKYILTFYFVYRLVNTPERIVNVLVIITTGCLYLGWLARNAPSSSYVDGRLNGVGGPGINDANSLSIMFACGVVIGSVLLMSRQDWRRYAALLCLPLILNGLILAASRGAFIAMAATGLGMAMLKSRRDRIKFWLLSVLAVLAFLQLSDIRFIDRLLTVSSFTEQAEEERDSSAQSRLIIMAAQVKMALRYPHGTGHKGTVVLSPDYLDQKWLTGKNEELGTIGGRSSHNTFLTLWVEQGIIGVLLFIVMLIWGVQSTLRLRRVFRDNLLSPSDGVSVLAPICCLSAILFAGIFTDYLLLEIQIWMLALLASANANIVLPLLAGKQIATHDSPKLPASEKARDRKRRRRPRATMKPR